MMERDKDDVAMEAMLMPSMQSHQLSVGSHQQNLKPPLSKPANYSALLENDESFFDGILSSGDHGMQHSTTSNISHQFATNSSSSKSNNHMAAVKRPPSSQFWNEVGSSMENSAAAGKRFHGDLNSSSTVGGVQNENNSFVSMLNQIPQSSAPFHHPSSILGSLGDGVLRPQYQLPSMNWNS